MCWLICANQYVLKCAVDRLRGQKWCLLLRFFWSLGGKRGQKRPGHRRDPRSTFPGQKQSASLPPRAIDQLGGTPHYLLLICFPLINVRVLTSKFLNGA